MFYIYPRGPMALNIRTIIGVRNSWVKHMSNAIETSISIPKIKESRPEAITNRLEFGPNY